MPKPRNARFATLALGAILLAACAGPAPLPEEEEPEIIEDALFEELSPQDQERYQPDMQLAAFWDGQALVVYVRNRSRRPVQVEPRNFGVILDGQPHPVDPATVTMRFPITTLRPGEMATGHLVFRQLGDLRGGYCFFRHPELRASRSPIRPIQERGPRR